MDSSAAGQALLEHFRWVDGHADVWRIFRRGRRHRRWQRRLALDANTVLIDPLAFGCSTDVATAFRDRFLFARHAVVRKLLDRSLARGEIATGTDLELLIDVVYGVLWYRLLLDQIPLNAAAGRQLAALVMRVVAPASPSVERPPPNDS